MIKRILTYIAIVLISTFTFLSIEETEGKLSQQSGVASAAKNEKTEFTDEIIKNKTNIFKQQLMQETDENGKVKAFETKKSFLKSFDLYVDKDALLQFTDVLYEEKENGLYLISLDTPPWFNPDNDYDMIEVAKDKMVVQQENTSALNGTYNISFTFIYKDGWQVLDVDYK